MSWRSESPFTVGFRAYVGFWFHCSPNPKLLALQTALLQGFLFAGDLLKAAANIDTVGQGVAEPLSISGPMRLQL
ncbi:hypothetical protein CDO45_10630 [Pseudomonas aeruginosa]|nr:hypothetical protein APA84_33110 [Pseudomonas aeruginosa]OVZ17960.1 hypothetical protein CDO45_10630 [Pseudomonas aeruginosa]